MAILPGNMEKPQIWQFRQKNKMEKPGILNKKPGVFSYLSCSIVKFRFDTKDLLYK